MSPFTRPRPAERPRLRLVVLHHAGGSAAGYFPLARALPAEWDVLLLDLPGRGKRAGDAPLRDVGAVVAEVLDALADLDGDVPLALFGHSMGALVGVEAAHALTARGTPPLWLGVSGRLAPGVVAPGAEGRPALHEVDDDLLLAELRLLGGIPPQILQLPGFLRRFLDVVRADLEVVGRYREHDTGPRGPLPCPVTAFGGTHDPWAPAALLHHWRAHTSAGYTQALFPGGHFYFSADGAAALADRLDSAVRRALPATRVTAVSATS